MGDARRTYAAYFVDVHHFSLIALSRTRGPLRKCSFDSLLLIVSYVVFLVLAHITQRRPAPRRGIRGSRRRSGCLPGRRRGHCRCRRRPLARAEGLTRGPLRHLPHRTLMANADLEDGPVHRRAPDAKSQYPRSSGGACKGHKDSACVAVAVFAPSETDVRCVCKRRRHKHGHRRRKGRGGASVVVDAHTAWTLRETEQEAGLVFVKAGVLRDGRVVPPEDDDTDRKRPLWSSRRLTRPRAPRALRLTSRPRATATSRR